MENLTYKQKLIYDFIQDYLQNNHVPPSLREIGAHLDLSVGTVQDQVEAIRKKAYLEKEQSKARGLRLPFRVQQIPIIGRVHAGPLHTAFENVEGHLPVGQTRVVAEHFGLRVRGDSMIEAGILEGDLVIVRVQSHAEDGDIVVARIEDEATIKRLRKKGGKPYLQAENPRYAPIHLPFEIVGVVVELRRHYK